MLRTRRKQVFIFLGAVAIIGASAMASQYVWREAGLKSLQAVNEQRVQLVANALTAEVGRQDHLPVVLSLDPDVRNALRSRDAGSLERLSRKLEVVSREADTRALYLIAPNGIVVASDNWQAPDTLVGRNLADQPYFKKAVENGRSSDLGVEPESNRTRYYLAESVRAGADLLGIAVVRIEFDALEAAWERAAERVLVADPDGIVFLASDPAYKYRSIGGKTVSDSAEVAKRYPGVLAEPIHFAMLERRGADSIIDVESPDAGASYLYQTMQLPLYGWTIHRFTDLASVREDQRDGTIIGGAIVALIIALVLYVIERHRAYVVEKAAATQLKTQVEERTRDLSESNASLQTEIDEHRHTEARLRTTQNELVQAGKLAALGQMSAALAHEINQPLAAIRTFMASTKIYLQRGDSKQVIKNLDLIDGLAERMANITTHLKAFARKSEPGRPEQVEVARAVEGALFLVESQIKAAGVRLNRAIEPGLRVSGYAVQLEQVLVNLIANALDAVADVKEPAIGIEVRGTQDTVRIRIADNGPGIPPEVIERIFDPFMTTKPIGKGLGLGLSITYGIVQDFRGHMHAENRAGGGAELIVELPRLTLEATVQKAVHA